MKKITLLSFAFSTALSSVFSPMAIAAEPPTMAPTDAVELSLERFARLNIGLGYVDSQWAAFSPRLRNGSLLYHLGFSREFMTNFEAGWNLEYLSGSTGLESNENIWAWHFAFEAKYFLNKGKFRPFCGMGLGFGAYRAWSIVSQSSASVSYQKHAGGALVGAIPALGFRLELSSISSVDISLSYLGYLDNPASRGGGWALGATMGFGR